MNLQFTMLQVAEENVLGISEVNCFVVLQVVKLH